MIVGQDWCAHYQVDLEILILLASFHVVLSCSCCCFHGPGGTWHRGPVPKRLRSLAYNTDPCITLVSGLNILHPISVYQETVCSSLFLLPAWDGCAYSCEACSTSLSLFSQPIEPCWPLGHKDTAQPTGQTCWYKYVCNFWLSEDKGFWNDNLPIIQCAILMYKICCNQKDRVCLVQY